jgi:hypothetical protein
VVVDSFSLYGVQSRLLDLFKGKDPKKISTLLNAVIPSVNAHEQSYSLDHELAIKAGKDVAWKSQLQEWLHEQEVETRESLVQTWSAGAVLWPRIIACIRKLNLMFLDLER